LGGKGAFKKEREKNLTTKGKGGSHFERPGSGVTSYTLEKKEEIEVTLPGDLSKGPRRERWTFRG